MMRLQDVFASMTDDQAMAAWHALSAHLENEHCDADEPDDTLRPVVEALDAVIAELAP